MNRTLKLIIWSALASFAVITLFSFAVHAPELVGKKYTEQPQFADKIEQAYDQLAVTALYPFDADALRGEMPVSKEEIEEHRNRYGNLAEQLENITAQYKERIAQAKEQKNETLLLALVKERDTKLQDIEKNFNSDAHIAEKIRDEKAVKLERAIEDIKNQQGSRLPLAYDLTNTETGERLAKGDMTAPSIYKQTFNETNGYFTARPFTEIASEYGYLDDDEIEVYYDNVALTDNFVRDRIFTLQSLNEPHFFEGTIIVPESALTGMLKEEAEAFTQGKYSVYGFAAAGALALIALLTVFRLKKKWVLQSRVSAFYARWKMDVKLAVFAVTALILMNYYSMEIYSLLNQMTYFRLGTAGRMLSGFVVFGALLPAFAIIQAVHLVEELRGEDAIEKAWKDSYTADFLRNLWGMFEHRTLGIQLFFLLMVFFLAGIGLVGAVYDGMLLMIYALCVLFVALPAFFLFVKRAAYLNKILTAAEQMAAGRLTEEIEVKGNSPLAKHAENLNNLREGVRRSISEQAKSERLKTELITNVSHDLRTPLTSIITYTDLLKDEHLSAEDRAKYIAVVDQKSQRLKTLIEDLFEVSKMASGNIELVKQRVDMNQLIQQAVAEHAEDFAEADLQVRADLPEPPIYAYADGQKWWRVIDNLLNNALKYSMPKTRVYIDLQQAGTEMVLSVKNVSNYEIGGNTDELFERFKRADESRQTEGSGLGLAIAQSIVDLHGGRMAVEADGDLFKVTVWIAAG